MLLYFDTSLLQARSGRCVIEKYTGVHLSAKRNSILRVQYILRVPQISEVSCPADSESSCNSVPRLVDTSSSGSGSDSGSWAGLRVKI